MNSRLLYFFILLPSMLCAQGRSNLWLSGYDSGGGAGFGGTNIDFNSGLPFIYQHNRPMNITESFSSMTDKNGNLLFYTNGYYIANRNDDTLLNGTNFNSGSVTNAYAINGLPITQGILIIPSQSDTNQYYLFSLSAESLDSSVQPIRLTCTLIDMTLDSGLGGALWKDSTVINDTLAMGMLTACKHGNGRDWWVTIPENHSNCYYLLLLSPSGISQPVKQCLSQTAGYFDWSGQATFSPNGEKYARYDKDNGLLIFDFDRCNGTFLNPLYLVINDTSQCGGTAFSPNSQYLYVSSFNYIYQFDMLAPDILASKTTVGIYDGFSSPFNTTFFLEQLAPDGRIYIAPNNGVNVMHCINSPDSGGSACDLQQHSIQLPTYNALTLPNHPNYFLEPLTGSICDSLNIGIPNIQPSLFEITLYPNPTFNKICVTVNLPQAFTATLFNSIGEIIKVIKSNSEKLEFDLTEFNSGIYYIKFQNEKFSIAKKIIKN